MLIRPRILLGLLLQTILLFPLSLSAQEVELRDTLRAAMVTGMRRSVMETGSLRTSREMMKSVASPLGEGDPIRWIQYLPGVSSGADGTSASYVRGGNVGGNLLTLDGIPVYGYSHVLGLTTVIPNEEVETVSFAKGGFGGGQGNFTSSHIAVTTRKPATDRIKKTIVANNFLAGGSISGAITDRLSFSVSGRVSPLALEYGFLRGLLPESSFSSLRKFRARVGDLYGKVHWQIAPNQSLTASVLGSMDRYGFMTSDDSDQSIGWGNVIGAVRYIREGERWSTAATLSYNAYDGVQRLVSEDFDLDFTLRSRRDEITLSGDFTRKSEGPFKLITGGQVKYAVFNPAKVAGAVNRKQTWLGLAYLQAGIDTDKLDLEATVRPMLFRSDTTYVSVDVNVRAKWQFLPFLALEATFDRMAQYYHTLEGLPVGWSMDLQIPTTMRVPSEKMMQGYAGLVATFGSHTLSAGAYVKTLDDVIYFKEAQNLFDPSITSWEGELDLGQGDSKGVELMYLYQGKDLYVQASATLSKSTRWGFPEVNGGKPFHAPFDRGMVGSVLVQWKGASVSFTYQDGNWVNGQGMRYTVLDPTGERVELKYFRSENDYQMPALIRLDIGYRFEWVGERVSHELNLGVYNVLNHFNPFTVYYNSKEKTWKELALVPILPNLSYRVRF